MAKKKQKNKIADSKLNSLTHQLMASQTQIERLQSQISSLQKQQEQEKKNKIAASEIENSYKKNRVTHLLNLNITYTELRKTIKITNSTNFEKRISNLRGTVSKIREKIIYTDKEITKRTEELREQEKLIKIKEAINKKEVATKPSNKKSKQVALPKPQFSPMFPPNFNAGITGFDAEWDNVSFADSFITIKHNGHWYRKNITQSKKYLNEIKHFYKFHNVPKLRIILSGSIELLRWVKFAK